MTQQVVVYFYNGRWVPIMFYSLASALELHRQAALLGRELYIFPKHVDPHQFDSFEYTLDNTKHHLTHTISTNHRTNRSIQHFMKDKMVILHHQHDDMKMNHY